MRIILNVIWLVLCGFWMALAYVAAGIISFILIITIPFGVASFRTRTMSCARSGARPCRAGAPGSAP
jgi:uncharacterized membrane protein YccF (DUF307 family)